MLRHSASRRQERYARASRRLAWAITLLAATGGAFAAPTTNTIPWSDTFEQYTNNTPLIDGTNGWYGSSAEIIVLSNTAFAATGSTNSAMIPVDCTLSNRFQSLATTNVWLQMDVRPSLYDETNNPVVDTNAAGMFYINSNGYFVVHNGPASPDPTNSANWVVLTTNAAGQSITPVALDTWVRVHVYLNYAATNWALYADHVLLTNNSGFVNVAITNFNGFDVYSGSSTSYLDNVCVSNTTPSDLPGVIGLSVTTLTYTVTYGSSPPNQPVVMTNVGQAMFAYSNTVSYGSGAGWFTVTPVTGQVAVGASQVLTGTVNSAALNVGVYVATNTISSPDATNAPRTFVATLTVNKAALTAALVPTISKVYDGNTNATLGSTNYSLSGLIGSETSAVNQTVGYYATSNAGTGIRVTATLTAANFPEGAGGFSTNNYSLPAAATGDVGVITAKALTLVGIIANNKVYDATTTATISSYGTTNGIVAGDIGNVAVNYGSASAAFDTATAGNNKTVTVSGLALSGTAAGNYSITSPTTTADITQANQTITFPAIPIQPFTNGTLGLSATASSSLAVTNFAVVGGGPGTISGTNLTFTGLGNISIAAAQTGNVNYVAAPSVTNTFFIYGSSFKTNTIPWSDNFETYLNNTPLVDGTNGWYGSSTAIIVQTNVVATGLYITATGTNAAMLPGDVTLSNRFVAGTPLNTRIAMDLRPVRFDETNSPDVDTNATFMFYVDTNGHFVVCNGLGTTSTWCMVSNAVGSGSEFVVTNDTWAHIVIYLDYRNRNWKLRANNVLITNKIGFVTQQTNGFRGFAVHNSGLSTSYLDNVSANWWDRFKVNGVLDHLIRSVNGVIPDRINGVE